MILSLAYTKKEEPVKPPKHVMVTVLKKEKPYNKASGTPPKTNLTVLIKNTDTTSNHDDGSIVDTFIISFCHRQGLLHRPGLVRYKTLQLTLRLQRHTKW